MILGNTLIFLTIQKIYHSSVKKIKYIRNIV